MMRFLFPSVGWIFEIFHQCVLYLSTLCILSNEADLKFSYPGRHCIVPFTVQSTSDIPILQLNNFMKLFDELWEFACFPIGWQLQNIVHGLTGIICPFLGNNFVFTWLSDKFLQIVCVVFKIFRKLWNMFLILSL